jgi:hypothetical protein
LLFGVVGLDRLTRMFSTLFDPEEFLAPHGLRALSAIHREHPYELDVEGLRASIDYEPGGVDGGVERLQSDPRWRDNITFSEYFNGDNAASLGASHQTGWTGLVANVIRRRHGAVPSITDILLAPPFR